MLKLCRRGRGREREERGQERGRQRQRGSEGEIERVIEVFKSDTIFPKDAHTTSLKYMNVTLESKVEVLKSRQLS